MASLQILSDIHLEFYNDKIRLSNFINIKGDYLAILGDIGHPFSKQYSNLLLDASNSFKKVFIIAGNHEYYSTKTMKDIKTQIQQLCDNYDNVYFLDNSAYILNGYVILGTTLWTHIPIEEHMMAKYGINDFLKIHTSEFEKLTPSDVNNFYSENVKWIKTQVEKFKDKKIILLSHHLPSELLVHKKYAGFPLGKCFYSDLDHLIKKPIVYWLCGHSHASMDMLINDCRCIINSVGYPQRENTENAFFDKNLIINLD